MGLGWSCGLGPVAWARGRARVGYVAAPPSHLTHAYAFLCRLVPQAPSAWLSLRRGLQHWQQCTRHSNCRKGGRLPQGGGKKGGGRRVGMQMPDDLQQACI